VQNKLSNRYCTLNRGDSIESTWLISQQTVDVVYLSFLTVDGRTGNYAEGRPHRAQMWLPARVPYVDPYLVGSGPLGLYAEGSSFQ